MNLNITRFWLMAEVQSYRDWVGMVPLISKGQSYKDTPWVTPVNLRIVGARFFLLVGQPMQELLDVLACVSTNPERPAEQMNLKVDHLFYAQRDAYAKSQGVSDLVHFEMFPNPYGFEFDEGTSIYAWAYVQNFIDKCGMFDIGIDVLWIPTGP